MPHNEDSSQPLAAHQHLPQPQASNPSPTPSASLRSWQRWTPYAALAWSLVYAALGLYWALGGHGFPFSLTPDTNPFGPLAGRFGQSVAWAIVVVTGVPAATLAAAMLRGVGGRSVRPLFITSGALLGGVLLLFMTDLNLLILLGYLPYTVYSLFTGSQFSQVFLEMVVQSSFPHQLLCIIGGFFWLAATIIYARRSRDACLYCGRRPGPEGWTSPLVAVRWGRIALVVAMIAPLFYAFTRFAWALGIPLGMTEQYLREGQANGLWISGLFLATFGLLGAVLMFGLVQRWGEVFPRWMIGLSGRRVPISLALIPASLVSVLLVVGGIVIWSGLGQIIATQSASGAAKREIVGAIIFQVGPTLLFPVWGIALAVEALSYYLRRRGPCSVCGRGLVAPFASQAEQTVNP